MHPFNHVRGEHHDRAHEALHRSGNKVPHRARGGATNHPDAREDAAMIRTAMAEHESHDHPGKPKTKLKFADGGGVDGERGVHHLGKRARGGHADGKGGKHVTNVIIAPQGGGAGGGMRPAMPPGQPMAAPRPAMPPAGPPPGAGGPPMGPPPGGQPMGMRPPGAMKRGGGVKRADGGSAEDCDTRPERKRGGHVTETEEAGKPWQSTMEANKGGKVKKRDMGGSAGLPADPTQLSAQQLQRIAQMRQQQRMAAQQRVPAQGLSSGAMHPATPSAAAARMSPAAMAQQKSGGEVRVKEHTRRARGGHVHMDAGAGGGEGRIEKMHEYGGSRGFKPKKVPLHA